MQLNTREGRGTPGRDGRFCLRVYRKNELARLYFPELDKKSALQGLARWIKRCRELEEALAAAGYDKNRKFFLKPEVELIVRFLGEPERGSEKIISSKVFVCLHKSTRRERRVVSLLCKRKTNHQSSFLTFNY